MSALFRDLLRLFGKTTVPSSPAAGDVWYRTDTGQVQASDGIAGAQQPIIGPYGELPVIRPAAWHTRPPFGSQTSANIPADRLFALPFWTGRSCTLTACAVNVTLALVGGNVRMGLYQGTPGGLPGTLISDYGTVSAGLTGIRQISGLSTAVRPVLNYFVIGRQGGLLSMGLTMRDTWSPIVSETTPTLTGNLNTYYVDGVSGALPASFGTPAGTVQGPAVSLQLT